MAHERHLQCRFLVGALVMVIDIGKGVLAMAVAKQLLLPHSELAYYAAGIIVILGHNFPVFLKFRGEKAALPLSAYSVI